MLDKEISRFFIIIIMFVALISFNNLKNSSPNIDDQSIDNVETNDDLGYAKKAINLAPYNDVKQKTLLTNPVFIQYINIEN
jgi:hypothetical protein